MEQAPSDPDILWVAELDLREPLSRLYGRLYKTENATAVGMPVEWTTIDDNVPSPTATPTASPTGTPVIHRDPLPNRNILKILVDPTDASTVYVGFGAGYLSGDGENNLYRTTDGGDNWTDITGGSTNCSRFLPPDGLPCAPISAIALDPYHSGKIYVGTFIGIYVTENANAANPEDIVWKPVTNGPANVIISDLNFLKNTPPYGPTTLLAATYGRGLWTARIIPPFYPRKAVNDFDGDGRSDVAVVRDDGAHLNWHRQGSSDGYNAAQFGAAGDQVAPADYDGDGKADMSVFRPLESRWYSLLSSSNTLATTDLGNENSEKVPADYDGDSLADKAAFDKFTGTWEVERTENGNLTFVWGAEGDTPVSIDIDGDEKADYGVLHEENGVITLSVKTEVGEEFHKQFGLEGDVAVPGEYDGDHKIDLAVWRPDDDGEGNGCWYIVHAADGWTEVTDIPWGENGDIPVPGDYDGDGKLDIAVWRPSTGVWHMLQSSNGYYSELFGASGDTPVGIKVVYAARPSGRPFTRVPPNAVPRRRMYNTDKPNMTTAD